MKRLLLIVLPLLLIVGCSEVEGQQQQLIPQITETYKNGNVKSITYHKKTRDGIQKVKEEGYHKNGQKWLEETYKDGKLAGKWVDWYENGEKVSEETFKDGEVISEKCWDEDGYERECYSMKRLWLK